jgi:hypothetical protein
MASLGLPHWLMIGGFVLVLAGFVGLAWTRHTPVEADPASPPEDFDDTKPPADEAEDMKTKGDGAQAKTAGRAGNTRGHSGTELRHRA